MLQDTITLVDTAQIINLVVARGNAFPVTGNVGELFYRSDLLLLHSYNGSTWVPVGNVGYTPVNKAGDSMTGALTLNADPVTPLHAATKQYVDAVASGLDPKGSVRAATTANITLSGTQTIDGVALVAGNRVLVKNQTTQSQNGIYVVDAGAWNRASDFDTNAEVTAGAYTFVEQGTVNAGIGYVLITPDPIDLGTTALTFSSFSSSAGGTVTSIAATPPSAGLTISGGPIITSGTLVFALADDLAAVEALSTTGYVRRTSSNSWDTVASLPAAELSGTIPIANGGTGQTTANAAFNALAPSQTGQSGRYLTTNGTTTSWGTVAGGGTPGGANAQIQFNSGGSFAGDAELSWDSSGNILTVGGIIKGANTGSPNIELQGGSAPSGQGGSVIVSASNASGNGTSGGDLTLRAGASGSGVATAGSVSLIAGTSAGGTAGSLIYTTGGTERLRMVANGAWSVGANGTSFGTSGQVLTSTGSGSAPVWQTITASAPAAGSNTQVQFNNGSAFAGDADFTWILGSNILTVGSVATPGTIRGGDGNGGHLTVSGGSQPALGGSSGNLILQGGDGQANVTTPSGGGSITVRAGNAGACASGTAIPGTVNITGGLGRSTNLASGATSGFTGGTVNITGGRGGSNGQSGGGTTGDGGPVIIQGGLSGTATSGSNFGAGGSIQFQTGSTSYTTRLTITGQGAFQFAGSAGGSGQVLTSTGANTSPTWQDVAIPTHTLFTSTSTAGNTANTTSQLHSYTMPANTLGTNNMSVEWYSAGTLGTGASTNKRITVIFGGATLIDSGDMNTTSNGGDWSIRGSFVRVSSTTIKSTVVLTITSGGTNFKTQSQYLAASVNLTAAQQFAVNGSGSNASDVVAQMTKLKYESA